MKFLHQRSDQICRFVDAGGWQILACDTSGQNNTTQSSADAIVDLLAVSGKLWGDSADYYLTASDRPIEWMMSLSEAVGEIETAKASGIFLIVAYPDGGLISVSEKPLPFQAEADSAEWWKPAKYQ